MKLTQRQMLLNHLLAGNSITQLEALSLYGIGRLASRINELRESGIFVRSNFVKVRKADGSTAVVKEYWLGPETIKAMEGLR